MWIAKVYKSLLKTADICEISNKQEKELFQNIFIFNIKNTTCSTPLKVPHWRKKSKQKKNQIIEFKKFGYFWTNTSWSPLWFHFVWGRVLTHSLTLLCKNVPDQTVKLWECLLGMTFFRVPTGLYINFPKIPGIQMRCGHSKSFQVSPLGSIRSLSVESHSFCHILCTMCVVFLSILCAIYFC